MQPGYVIKPGTRVRAESVYDSSQKRLGMPCPLASDALPIQTGNAASGSHLMCIAGVMGIMIIWVSGLTNNCNGVTSQAPMSLVEHLHPNAGALLGSSPHKMASWPNVGVQPVLLCQR